jgi:ATP-dependent DNA helicase RecQ
MAWALRRIDSREVSPEVKQVQTRKARQLYAMLDGLGCRAAAVRRYFGEDGVEACGQCDVCLNPPKARDATEQAQKALAAVHRLGAGRYGRGRIVDHLLGKTKEPSAHEQSLSTFGIGAELPAAHWRSILDQLLFEGLLKEDPNEGRPLILLGDAEAVRAVYRGERKVQVRELAPTRPGREKSGRERKARAPAGEIPSHSQFLFDALRAWRREEAARQGLPPYVIFHDRTLQEIAVARPSSDAELEQVSGVGQSKRDRYGEAVLRLVRNA